MHSGDIDRSAAPYRKAVTFRLPRRGYTPVTAQAQVEHLFHAGLPDGSAAVFGVYAVFILLYGKDERGEAVCSQTVLHQSFTVPVPGGAPGAQTVGADFEPHAVLHASIRPGVWTVEISAQARALFPEDEEEPPEEEPPEEETREAPDGGEAETAGFFPAAPSGEGEEPAAPAGEAPDAPEEAPGPAAQEGDAPDAPDGDEALPAAPGGDAEELAASDVFGRCWRVRDDVPISAQELLELSDAQRGAFMEECD